MQRRYRADSEDSPTPVRPKSSPSTPPFPALFLSFEGIDGSGKSTQAALLAESLSAKGLTVLSVREPGGTALGEAIRAMLLDPARHINARAELLLFSAARAQLVEELVRPALERGEIVIADRFYDSSSAYQGAGRGVGAADWMAQLHHFATDGLRPDKTFLVDIDPDEALRRRGDRAADRMEQADTAFYERVRAAYLDQSRAEADRFVVLDGTRTREELQEEIQRVVELQASGQ